MPLILILVFTLSWSSVSCAVASLEIQVKQQKIMVPYWKGVRTPHGGVLIIQGGDPVYGEIFLKSLASYLADSGWSVILLNTQFQASTPWVDQLPEGLSLLRKQKNNRIIVIHYGNELQTTLGYFTKQQSKQVNGLILLSAFDLPIPKETIILSEKIRFPVYDIVGQFDYQDVLLQMQARKEQSTAKQYITMKFPGAQHDYAYTRRLLANFLSGWMLHIQAASPAKPPISKR